MKSAVSKTKFKLMRILTKNETKKNSLLIKAKKTSDDYQQLKKLREAGEFK
jgi:hypothetical protein